MAGFFAVDLGDLAQVDGVAAELRAVGGFVGSVGNHGFCERDV